MKPSILSLASLALVPVASAHYIFGRLILEGKLTDTWEYIREISRHPTMSEDLSLVAPNVNPDSSDLRCGRNASTSWSNVKTATVSAGDTVGFHVGDPGLENPVNYDQYMYHPGFASAWLSKAPDGDLKAYTGDGEWVKIFALTHPTEQSRNWTSPEWKGHHDVFKSLWGTFLLSSVANFTIPATTPPGNYLLRFEHIFPNVYDAQYYVNCAHVEIKNSGSTSTPSPTVKIPGVYTRGQKDVYFSTYDYALEHNFDISSFEPPAPAVWSG